MSSLTTKEKAHRYDALQMAIKLTIESYQKRVDYAELTRFPDIINAYNRGLIDAYRMAMNDLGRWVE